MTTQEIIQNNLNDLSSNPTRGKASWIGYAAVRELVRLGVVTADRKTIDLISKYTRENVEGER